MKSGYACVCCAVPKNMMRHLAQESDDPAHRQLLLDQVARTSGLRARRASAISTATSHARGAKPLHRRIFDAQQETMLPGQLLRDEGKPPSNDEAANEVYDNLGLALQFFSGVLGLNSADGAGMRIEASVHYDFKFINAMWTGHQMAVGDGDGKAVRHLSRSLGIIAHEFSHAVSQHLVKGGLGVVQLPDRPPELKGEAGALNESFSDVFASMIKQWHAGHDVKQADWLLGEDIVSGHRNHAVRSLKEPGNKSITWAKDDQVKDYRNFKPTQEAHTASGIGNHAFYLAAKQVGGRSWESLARVWFQGFSRLRARATFLDAAHETMAAAAAIHGKTSTVYEAVRAGWKSVHVL
jgi:Zn-dependent metalloprotease